MEVVGGDIGPEAKYSVKFEAGKLVASIGYSGKQAGVDLAVKIEAEQIVHAIIDEAEKAIPGDQVALATMLKAFLAGMVK